MRRTFLWQVDFLEGLMILSVLIFLNFFSSPPFILVDARALPSASPLSLPPILSPPPLSSSFLPNSSSTMTAFSPGTVAASIEAPKMDHNRKRLVIPLVIACSSFGLIMVSLFILWMYLHRKTADKNNNGIISVSRWLVDKEFAPNHQLVKSINGKKIGSACFDYKLLETATGNFEESKKVGEGGFGCVYKGQLEDRSYVAVKRLEVGGGGPDAEMEFQNEVELLSKIHHPNVITLFGFSIHGDSRFIVYELMENGSLETQLHGPSRGSGLTWHTRMKIALDIARGLEYLHEHCNPPVIHKDLKSSNVLLDSNFNAKLSDFGLAVLDDGSQDKNENKLSGTLGYVAPEYLLDGKLTDKSDVYAFGVVLLELLLGRKPVEKLSASQCQSIVTWAMPQLTDRSKLPSIVDPAIQDTIDLKHLYQVAAVAVLCVQPEPSYRPLITDVLHSLIPLVPAELGGTLRVAPRMPSSTVALLSSDQQQEV